MRVFTTWAVGFECGLCGGYCVKKRFLPEFVCVCVGCCVGCVRVFVGVLALEFWCWS